MKMYYGNVPIESMNIKHYEMDTNDCTMVPSDLQAGVTGVARGKKIVGTGKCFEFASYGAMETNLPDIIPNNINVIEISSIYYPIQITIPLSEMKNMDFSTELKVADVIVDGEAYPLTVLASNNELNISCDKTIKLEVFYGKDNYV